MKKIITPLKRLFTILLILVIVGILGLVVYIQIATSRPDATAKAALHSTDQVDVEDNTWLIFKPRGNEPRSGFIFYPGGLVDERAYAPFGQEIAAAGYLVVIPVMPLKLAILNVGEASDITEAFPEIRNWAVGGHSLGGVSATRFVKEYPWAVDGLVLWGAYPDGKSDVSCRVLDAASIYGTRDGLSTPEEILAAKELLPPETSFIAIDGGNHAQFGWYGEQRGDQTAQISHQEQQRQTVEATLGLMEQIEKRKGGK